MTDLIMQRPPSSPTQGYAFTVLVSLFAAGLSSLAYAQEMLHWKDAWIRSMPPGAQVSAAYGILMNHSDQTAPCRQKKRDQQYRGNARSHC